MRSILNLAGLCALCGMARLHAAIPTFTKITPGEIITDEGIFGGCAWGDDDLDQWSPLTTVTNLTGTLEFTDLNVANDLRRFYRTVPR